VRAAAEGDQQAWSRLVDRFQGVVAATASGLGLKAADVADVCQTTWLRLFQNLGAIREPERVGGWLVTTARHEAIRVSRRSQRETVVDDDNTFAEEPSVASDADAELIAAERNLVLRGAVKTLTPRCQRLLGLLAEPESSYADVAAELRMPIGSLGPTRARCLDCLRRKPELATLRAG
jgi:RNA polymerase sigma factor (sigma-70 family)